MGGRGTGSGSRSRRSTASPTQQTTRVAPQAQTAPPIPPTPQPQTPQQPNTQPTNPAQASNWVPTGVLNYSLSQLATLNDAQALKVLQAADGIDMPNHLADAPDATQELVFALGLNAPPTVMDSTQFSTFMKQNNIPQSQVMSRMVGGGRYNTTAGSQRQLTQKQIAQMWIADPYNYIGGKHGGQALGAGAYFDMNGGKNTGYGGGNATMYTGVLNPKTAKVISTTQLARKASTWASSHPQADRKIRQMARKGPGWGNKTLSLLALMMGYNVITDGSGYYNVIDRSAMVIKQ